MRKETYKLILTAILIFSGSLSRAQQRSTLPKQFDQVAAQAEQARSANRIEEAIELYQKALSLNRRWAEGWWYLGALLYDRDDYADAAIALGHAVDLSPKVGTAWVMLGLCEFNLGRFEDSLKHIQQGRKIGISAEPQFRHVMLYYEGLLLLRKGEFEHAEETLDLLSREGVENNDVFTALGLSVLRVRWADPSKEIDPALREIARRAGTAEHLAEQKKFDQALSEYEQLVNDFSKMQGVQYAYGRFLIAVNQEEKAIAAFKRELENSPNHLPARLAIADTKFRLKEPAGGLPYAEDAVRLYPTVPLGHLLLGLLLLDVGQTTRAIMELEIAQRSLPSEPKIYFALGRAYARAGRKADAERARASFARLNNQTNSSLDQPSAAKEKSSNSEKSRRP